MASVKHLKWDECRKENLNVPACRDNAGKFAVRARTAGKKKRTTAAKPKRKPMSASAKKKRCIPGTTKKIGSGSQARCQCKTVGGGAKWVPSKRCGIKIKRKKK